VSRELITLLKTVGVLLVICCGGILPGHLRSGVLRGVLAMSRHAAEEEDWTCCCEPTEPPWWYDDPWVKSLGLIMVACLAALGIFRIVLFAVSGG
jgi:hypothetical protein